MQVPHSVTQAWLRTPLGRSLRAVESALVARALEEVYGLQLLQIGLWGEPGEFLAAARTQRRALASQWARPGVSLVCEPSHLGIAPHSVDAVLLPHTLELDPDPHELLREVDRILVGEGHLIVLGFHPRGLWGWRRALARGGFPPGMCRFVRERRIRDWLALLGFDVLGVRGYLYGVPFNKPRLLGITPGAEAAWGRLWPGLSGAYLLEARKRVFSATPIRPRWRRPRRVVGGLVEPTTRNTA